MTYNLLPTKSNLSVSIAKTYNLLPAKVKSLGIDRNDL